MRTNNPLFCLPERLETERPFGHHDIYRKQNEHVQAFSDEAQDDGILEAAGPTATIYGTDMGSSRKIAEPSPNVLTVIGVLPHQTQALLSYFRHNGYPFESDSQRVARGPNWVCLVFDEDVEKIACVNSTIQINENLIVSCFVGYFGYERCRAIVKRHAETGIKMMDLFKMKRGDDDLGGKALEKKTMMNKVREFIFGEKEIPRKRGTALGIIADTWESFLGLF